MTFSQLRNRRTAIFRFVERRFTAVVICKGVADQNQHGRGVALADFDGDGRTDVVYGNWNGPHRLFLQGGDSAFRVRTFAAVAAQRGSMRSHLRRALPSRTSRLRDLPGPLPSARSSLPTLTTTRSWRCFSTTFSTDNALRTEFSGTSIVLGRITDDNLPALLIVFFIEPRVSRRANADPLIEELNVGDAAEPQGRGTGRPSFNCSFVAFLQF